MPYPQNFPSFNELASWPVGDIAAFPADELASMQREADQALGNARACKARLDDALNIKYGEQAAAVRAREHKDTGTVRLQDGTIAVVADLPKKVVWDQNTLAAMVERIRSGGEDPAQYIDVTFKVSERKYNAWPDHIREAFTAARTVRTGKPGFKLINENGEDV